MSTAHFRTPAPSQQELLDGVELQLIAADDSDARSRFSQRIAQHHYLKSGRLVAEQLRYAAVFLGRWLALLSWCAAARQLKDREQWIGWSPAQRRERLALIANNARYLVLPGVDCPNLASRVLGTVSVESKSSEIPAARQLLKKLGPLDGRLVMLDALLVRGMLRRSMTSLY